MARGSRAPVVVFTVLAASVLALIVSDAAAARANLPRSATAGLALLIVVAAGTMVWWARALRRAWRMPPGAAPARPEAPVIALAQMCAWVVLPVSVALAMPRILYTLALLRYAWFGEPDTTIWLVMTAARALGACVATVGAAVTVRSVAGDYRLVRPGLAAAAAGLATDGGLNLLHAFGWLAGLGQGSGATGIELLAESSSDVANAMPALVLAMACVAARRAWPAPDDARPSP